MINLHGIWTESSLILLLLVNGCENLKLTFIDTIATSQTPTGVKFDSQIHS